MLSTLLPLMLLLLALSSHSLAQTTDSSTQYTVWASVLFTTPGDTTPSLLGSQSLTSLGAHQAYAAGSFFRDRYVASVDPSASDNASTVGTKQAPLQGLTAQLGDEDDVYALALDWAPSFATATAFLQGLYPPSLPPGLWTLQAEDMLAENSSYLPNPLRGYQYAPLHTISSSDFESVALAGNLNCPSFSSWTSSTRSSDSTSSLSADTKSLYRTFQPLLSPVLSDPSSWDFLNAAQIFEYLYYQYEHNATARDLLDSPTYADPETSQSYMVQLRELAAEQQRALLADSTSSPSYDLPLYNSGGHISTVAGATLLSQLYIRLLEALLGDTRPGRLSLLFAQRDPLVSLVRLLGLDELDANFARWLEPASSLVVEVYSVTNSSSLPEREGEDAQVPDAEDLWVQVFFRNGSALSNSSDPGAASYQSYPVFGRGPSATEMPWTRFRDLARGEMLVDEGAWCAICGSEAPLCATIAGYNNGAPSEASSSAAPSAGGGKEVSRVQAGVIGAVVALAVAGLGAGILAWLGGFRVSRHVRRSPSDGGVGGMVFSKKEMRGGFKGASKLGSDTDLRLPPNGDGVVVGASVDRSVEGGGHERVGSWEMKGQRRGDGDGGSIGEGDRVGGGRGVAPDERV